MYWHIVIKWIVCEPCRLLIDVKKFRTTAEDKPLQDSYIEDKIKHKGYPVCPQCLKKPSIVDPQVDKGFQRI